MEIRQFLLKRDAVLVHPGLVLRLQFLNDVSYFPVKMKSGAIYAWVKIFRVNPEFRILRLTFLRKSASK